MGKTLNVSKLLYLLIWIPMFSTPAVAGTTTINPKYEKWMAQSFFRGYNLSYWSPKTFQDFIDFKNYGGNFFQIMTGGFMETDKPYDIIQRHIDSTDKMVKHCDRAGIYYTIAVRSGPGAYDVYLEMEGLTRESRIWNSDNIAEQNLYAEMLKMIVKRYSADSLFIGINIFVEPRPKVRLIPANSSGLYKRFLENIFEIRMDRVYQFFLDEIRKIDDKIPVIIESFAFSNPELFPPYLMEDPYIVYDAHMYIPYEYTHAEPHQQKYPGEYKSITNLTSEMHNKDFLRETVFGEIREFQLKRKVPILIGEFGLKYPQSGGESYLGDIMEICLNYGWHFALWEWRNGEGEKWNIEEFEDGRYMDVLERYFKK